MGTTDGTKYKAENADFQVKIQKYVENELAGKHITQDSVDKALEEYYTQREKQIQTYLNASQTTDGTKYQAENTDVQVRIQTYVENELAGKEITQESVDQALTKYYREKQIQNFLNASQTADG